MKVYNQSWMPFVGKVSNVDKYCVYVIEQGCYSVHRDSPFSFRQCRPMEKVKVREWSCVTYDDGSIHSVDIIPSNKTGIIRVREVLEGTEDE